MWTRCISTHSLNTIRVSMGNQCRSLRVAVTWSCGPRRATSQAAAFWTRWSGAMVDFKVKADMVLFAGNTVWSISERVRGICVDALYKSTFTLLYFTSFDLQSDDSDRVMHMMQKLNIVKKIVWVSLFGIDISCCQKRAQAPEMYGCK